MATHKEMTDLMDELDRMQYAGEWKELDNIFENVDVETEDLHLLIVYLRHTYVGANVQKHCSKWDDLLVRAKAKYDQQEKGLFKFPLN